MKPEDLASIIPDVPGQTLAAPVERAALLSWPALSEQCLDGLLLRFSEGYTRRANCASAYTAGVMTVDDRIAACEASYAAQALPPIFRLTSAWPQPALDAALAERGYAFADVTHVLTLNLADHDMALETEQVWQQADPVPWVETYGQVSGSPPWQRVPQQRILQDIPGERLLCGLGPPGQPRACGLGVVDNGLLGLFDIAVRPDCQGQGNGRILVTALLSLGKANGARVAYLQVTKANVAARSLYDSVGFQELYHYWYRQKAGPATLALSAVRHGFQPALDGTGRPQADHP